MLDLSPEKLVVLAVIAMVVLGPDRLPSAARSLGRFVHQVRTLSSSVTAEMQDALAEPRKVLDDTVGELGLPRSIPRVPSVRSAVLSAVTAPAVREQPAPLASPAPATAAAPVVADRAGLPDDPGLN